MKRIRLFLIIAMIFSVIGSCTSLREDEVEQLKIGVSLYQAEDPFVSSIYNEMEQIIEKAEDETGQKIIINMVDAKESQGNQSNQVDEFISKRYDVLCINLVDRTAASLIISKAKEASIPVVFFNRQPVDEDLNMWEHVYYVGSDSVQAGVLAGELVVDAYESAPREVDQNNDGILQYVMIEGEAGHQDTVIRTEYSVKEILSQGIKLEKLASGTADWKRSPAYELMLEWIQEYGSNIEVVISNNDEMAIGALEAIDEYLMMDPIVIGTDGTEIGIEMLEEGKMYGTVYNDAPKQAEEIMDIVIQVAKNLTVDEPVVMVPHSKMK